MNTKKPYIAPFTQVVCIATEGRLTVPVSGVNINNTGDGDERDPGSIDYDNSGDLGGITPAKGGGLWDDDEEDYF